MSLSFRTTDLIAVNDFCRNTMLAHLDIRITRLQDNEIEGTMPVDHRTHQPMGLLHGGANATLIESLGSLGSALMVDPSKHAVVGIEINANHLRSVRAGRVTGIAKLVHGGRRTHVWEVSIYSEDQKLLCLGRLTNIVVEHSTNQPG